MPRPDAQPELPAEWSDGLVESGYGSAVVADMVSWPARIRRMLAVEVALAHAQAQVGLLDAALADQVADACDPGKLAQHDPGLRQLGQAAATATSPVIPLLRVIRRQAGAPAADAVHRGATSQDIVDTAMVLCVRDALDHLDDELRTLAGHCAELAHAHRATVMAGRTLGQQAVPITFGLKAARWLGAVTRRIQHLAWTRDRVCVLQFGGAAGTLAGYGPQALALAAAVADRLGLAEPDIPWHAERDRVAELAGALAAIIGVTGTISGELVRLASTEIGEVVPARGEGTGSSAMPHKTNPADAVAARAAGRLAAGEISVLAHAAAGHQHERGAGAWQAEWVALPGALVRSAGALERTVAAVSTVTVKPERMRLNLDRGLGLTSGEALTTALTEVTDTHTAKQLVAELAGETRRTGRPLDEVAAGDDRVTRLLGTEQIAEITDPGAGLAHVDALIDRALDRYRTEVEEHRSP